MPKICSLFKVLFNQWIELYIKDKNVIGTNCIFSGLIVQIVWVYQIIKIKSDILIKYTSVHHQETF